MADRHPVQRVIDLGPCAKCGEVHQWCKAHNRAGQPCRSYARPHMLVCDRHGGKSPRAEAGAQRRAARERALGEVGQLLNEALGVVEGMTGAEQMLAGINHAGSMALAYRWLLDELPERSKWSWVEVDGAQGSRSRWVVVHDDGLVGPDSQGVMRLHVYEEGFRHWTRLHGQLLKAAADIGLEERRQAFAQAQVQTIAGAVRGIVQGLGRDLDDPDVVPVVEAALRAITAGTVTT